VDTNERIARNEALFREVNERVREVQGGREGWTGFLCECGRVDCTSTVDLDLAEYEQARADPTTFIVLPGHDIPAVEERLQTADRYVVVRKLATESEIALETDRRAG